jgi:hypothetical protein
MFTVSLTDPLDQSAVVIGDDVLHRYGIYMLLNVAENSFHTEHGFVYTYSIKCFCMTYMKCVSLPGRIRENSEESFPGFEFVTESLFRIL